MANGAKKTPIKPKPKAKTPAKRKVTVSYQLTKTLIELHNNHKDIYDQMEKEGINTKPEITYIYNWIHLKPTLLVRIATARAIKPLTTWIKDNKKMERLQRENFKSLEVFTAFSNSQVSGTWKTEGGGASSTSLFSPPLFSSSTSLFSSPLFAAPTSSSHNDVVTLEKRPGGAYQFGGKKVTKIEIE